MAGNIVLMPFIAGAAKHICNIIMMWKRAKAHLRDRFIVLPFSTACEPDLISACFNMDVCNKAIPVFFLFSGTISIFCSTYHAIMFVNHMAKAESWISLAFWDIFPL